MNGRNPATSNRFDDHDPFLLKHLPGTNPVAQELRQTVHSLNTDNLDVVRFVTIVGPTGTGKNHLARVCAGHARWLGIRQSPEELDPGKGFSNGIGPLELYTDRFGEQMLTALPDQIAESLLFGHVRGAFSDAHRDYVGLFRDKGYDHIFLDEIGDASPVIQAKLLAVLEGRPFTPLGGTSKEKAKCEKRILMATNRDLSELVKKGAFREDLFYRVRRHTIALKPLAETPDLIPEIADAIVGGLCPTRLRDRNGRPPVLSVSDKDWLKRQRWTGNVREVEEVIELWLAAGCVKDVQTVAASRHFGGHDTSASKKPEDLGAAVRAAIDEIVTGTRPSPGTISQFIETFTADIDTEVRAALCDWYREARPDQDTLARLFPQMQIGSIRTQMSRSRRTS